MAPLAPLERVGKMFFIITFKGLCWPLLLGRNVSAMERAINLLGIIIMELCERRNVSMAFKRALVVKKKSMVVT